MSVFVLFQPVGESIDGECIVGESIDGECIVGESIDGECIVGESIDGECIVGESIDGECKLVFALNTCAIKIYIFISTRLVSLMFGTSCCCKRDKLVEGNLLLLPEKKVSIFLKSKNNQFPQSNLFQEK